MSPLIRKLGPFDVTAVSYGCMNLSHAYGPPQPRDVSERLLRRALDLGVTHFDTAALYGFGINEQLVGDVLKSRPSNVIVASKCGLFGRDGKRVMDGRPESIREICEQSLRNLQTDCIDLYYLHRWDRRVPIEDSIGAMVELKHAGKIREIGLSEVGAATLRRAHAVHPIAKSRCLPSANVWASRSRHSARWGGGFSQASCAARPIWAMATSAAPCRASRRRTSRKTCASSTRCRTSPRRRAVPAPSSHWPGFSPGTPTSCSFRAPHGKITWSKTVVRTRFVCLQQRLPRSTPFCPRGRSQEPDIRLRRRSKMTPKNLGLGLESYRLTDL
jgi:hypothetical protein